MGRRFAVARRTPSCSDACRIRATTRSTARSSTPRVSCRNRCATRSSRRAANRRRISCARWWTPAFRPRPHTIAMFGGFKIQGRTADAAMKILEDALAIEDAGCFMLEFEAVPARIARLISQQLTIPTIGIGAGAGCDGQILLCYDLLGVFTDFKPKFTKRFAQLTEVAVGGLSKYVEEVKSGRFPDDDHSYSVDPKEYETFVDLVE